MKHGGRSANDSMYLTTYRADVASRTLRQKEYYNSSARNEWRCRWCWDFSKYTGEPCRFKLRYGEVGNWIERRRRRREANQRDSKFGKWVECHGLGWGLKGGLRCDFVPRWRIVKVGDMAKKTYSSLLTCCRFTCSSSSNSIILRAIKSRRLVQLEFLMSNQCSHKQFLPLLPTPQQMLQSRLIPKATHRKPTPSSRVLHLGFLGHKNHTLQTPYLLQSPPSTIPLLPPPITLMPQP